MTLLPSSYRQTDQGFIDMLNEMRYGRLSKEAIERFKSLNRAVHYEDGLAPTQLYVSSS